MICAFFSPTKIAATTILLLLLGTRRIVSAISDSGSSTSDIAPPFQKSGPLPQGLYLKHHVIPESVCEKLLHWLEHGVYKEQDDSPPELCPIPWQMGAQNRRVAQFGGCYNYESSVVEWPDDIAPIPEPLQRLLQQMLLPKLFPGTTEPLPCFTQCIINVYEADTVIPWHWDHTDFGDTVLVVCLGEARPLLLRRLKFPSLQHELRPGQCHHDEEKYATSDYECAIVSPRHGSCYILSGPSRYQWEHCVPPGSGRRISITFRTRRRGGGGGPTKNE